MQWDGPYVTQFTHISSLSINTSWICLLLTSFFSHIGHTEKLLCRGVRFVLLCCDIPDLFHSPIENRTKERKTQWVEILYDGNFLSLQKKIVPLFIFMKMCMQVRKLLCLQFYQKSNEKMSLASNKWSNQKNNGNFHWIAL